MPQSTYSYPFIRAWHQDSGSSRRYINDLIARAQREGAPERAIFYSYTRERWEIVDDIVSDMTRDRVIRAAKALDS